MAQAEGRLPRVHAGAEQLELEDGLQFAEAVGVEDLTPRRLWRTPANVLLSSPNSFSNDGSLVTRRVSNQSGWICLKSWPMSSIAKP